MPAPQSIWCTGRSQSLLAGCWELGNSHNITYGTLTLRPKPTELGQSQCSRRIGHPLTVLCEVPGTHFSTITVSRVGHLGIGVLRAIKALSAKLRKVWEAWMLTLERSWVLREKEVRDLEPHISSLISLFCCSFFQMGRPASFLPPPPSFSVDHPSPFLLHCPAHRGAAVSLSS